MSKSQLEALENESFLRWRSEVGKVEEENNFNTTPFEKNLDVWRQLWRVVERSDVICQIVDARNPLFY